MGLGDKLKVLFSDVTEMLTAPIEKAIGWGVERAVKRVMPHGYTYMEQVIKMLEEAPGSPSLKELVESGKLAEILNPLSPTQTHHSLPVWDRSTILSLTMIGGILGSPMGFFPYIGDVYAGGAGEKFKQDAAEVVLPALLVVPEAISSYFRGTMSEADLKKELARLGYASGKVDQLIEIMHPLLDPDKLRQLELRGEAEFEAVKDDLRKGGWTEERIAALKKLYQVIPGVQDLIRMAVREAFSPEIVAKFGTDADFPPEFAAWAAKQGLSADWAKNYWRAHWDLPSPSQGFEMFHRGIITQDELNTLLRTLDIMPYWRDKLVSMTYSIPTRVDIRRIYNLGIRDRSWVKEQYINLGYAPDNAEALTEFAARLATSENKDLTKTEVLSLYKKGVLDEDTTREYLADMEYSEDDVAYLLAVASTESAAATMELSLSQIKSLALAGLIDRAEATRRMAERGYSADDITKLYELWALEAPPQDALPSRTDLKNFYLDGIITFDEWIDGMYQLRYSEEVISWFYLAMIKSS